MGAYRYFTIKMRVMNDNNPLKAHKHNDLIQVRYGTLTMPEQLLFLTVIGRLDLRELTAETSVELTVKGFCGITGVATLN